MQLDAGRQVQPDGAFFVPIAGDLQHAGAGQAAVREQQVFGKGHAVLFAAAGDLDRQRQTGQLGEGRPGCFVKGQRHQRRARRDDRDVELLGDAVAEIGRADLGDGQAAGRDDQRIAVHGPAVAINFIAIGVPDRLDGAGLPALYTALRAFGQQHLDDVFGRAVAKQLALVLLVVRDAVLVHQRQKVARRVTRQGGAAKARVFAQEVGRRGAGVGEIAASAAGDADFFRDLFAVVYHQHRQAQLAGHAGAKQAGSARAHDDDIEFLHGRECRLPASIFETVPTHEALHHETSP